MNRSLRIGFGLAALTGMTLILACQSRVDPAMRVGPHPGASKLNRALVPARFTGKPDAMETGLTVGTETSETSAAIEGIEVPEGFVLELAAGPPLVAHPTFATFDDRGRLFVSENAGVNLSAEELETQLPNSVRLLEDQDGDGRFDKSTVFADKMTFPMGGAWHDGALYVASPPNIWRLADTDDDGVADQRAALVGQFGYTGNAASIHGCVAGPDGRLYWCDGYHGHEFKTANGETTSKREGSYIFSCLPDGGDVRIHCGGGMDNPVEVDFTDDGDMLGTVNIFHTQPRVDCLVHWLYGGAYPHRERVLSEIRVTGDLLGPVHRFGHVAISGTQRYRSGVMDPSWRDDFFAAFFNLGKVVRVELERDGATYRATQREFLSSTRRDFHPTDVAEDADGSLLVVDTGGWFYRGCPTSQFAKPEILGAIYRVRRQGVAGQSDPRGRSIDWTKLSNEQLARLLVDSRFAVSERAINECSRRGASILPTLREVLQREGSSEGLSAVWAVTRMVGAASSPNRAEPAAFHADARALILEALDSPHSKVRLAACRSLATYSDSAALDRLRTILLQDEEPLRREAATALGRLGDARAVPSLLLALGHGATGASESVSTVARDPGRAVEHAIVFALIEIADPSETRKGLASESPDVRRAALVALDQMTGGDLVASDILPFATASDTRLRREAARVFNRHAEWSGESASFIRGIIESSESIGEVGAELRKLLTRALADASVGEFVGMMLADPRTTSEQRELILAAMGDGQALVPHASWQAPLRILLEQRDPKALGETLTAIAALRTDLFRDRLLQLGSDNTLPLLSRVAALEVASGQRGSVPDGAFELLLTAVSAGGPSQSVGAAQKIGSIGLSKSQLLRLAPLLAKAPAGQLRELLRPFERSRDSEVAASLLGAVSQSPGLHGLVPHEFSDVIKQYPEEMLPAANELLDRIRAAEQAKLAQLDSLVPLLPLGDAARGRETFFTEKAKCASCHRIGDRGERIGPDLTTIGANRGAVDLLESIVLPSSTIVRTYEPYTITTVDGRVLNGLITRESTDVLHVQQQTGEPIAVARSEIEELAVSSVSIMPNGLEQALTPSEMADIVAYLLNRKDGAP